MAGARAAAVDAAAAAGGRSAGPLPIVGRAAKDSIVRTPRVLQRILVALALSFGVVATAHAAPRMPRNELLGLKLGMNDLEVRKKLERIGKLTEMQPESGGRKQIWSLEHRRFGTLNLRLDKEYKLQWCTAYAHAKKLRYTDVGDTTRARRAGRHIWIWATTGKSASESYQVTARGTDPVYCTSVALSGPTARPPGAEPDTAAADSIR